MSEGWIQDLEIELTRKNKVKRKLLKEIEDKIESVRLIEEDISAILNDKLGRSTSAEDVEWNLLDSRLNDKYDR
tara:strand:+ start:193 stop:414 length:222 start_codon:yes stop_codon:yes gene_type:complete